MNTRDEMDHIYKEQEKLKVKVELIQRECSHPKTKEVNYSYRVGVVDRVKACTECDFVFPYTYGMPEDFEAWLRAENKLHYYEAALFESKEYADGSHMAAKETVDRINREFNEFKKNKS